MLIIILIPGGPICFWFLFEAEKVLEKNLLFYKIFYETDNMKQMITLTKLPLWLVNCKKGKWALLILEIIDRINQVITIAMITLTNLFQQP
jgi:hypothetical protein